LHINLIISQNKNSLLYEMNNDLNKIFCFFLATLTLVFLLFASSAFATSAITPSCSAGKTQQLGLIQTTYNTTGYNSHPSNHAQYNTLVTNYATSSNLFGSGVANNINGSGNPMEQIVII
jgi:hypothetical protein